MIGPIVFKYTGLGYGWRHLKIVFIYYANLCFFLYVYCILIMIKMGKEEQKNSRAGPNCIYVRIIKFMKLN